MLLEISPQLRAAWMVWSTLLIGLGLYAISLSVRSRRGIARCVICGIPTLAGFFIMQIQAIAIRYLTGERQVLLWERGMIGQVPARAVLAGNLVLTAWLARLLIDELRWRKAHITDMSVKEGLDVLPAGLLYYFDDGQIKLVNATMKGLAEAVLGDDVRDGREFLDRIAGELQGGNGAVSLGRRGTWLFRHRAFPMEESIFHEITATDVTAEAELGDRLTADLEALRQMNRRLEALGPEIDRITVEKETLAAKIRIHDNAGRAMLATRRYLEGGAGSSPEGIWALWRDMSFLAPPAGGGREASPENAPRPSYDSVVRDLVTAAGALGIRLSVVDPEGILTDPGTERALIHLVTAGARECLTNAYRHAGAERLSIGLSRSGGFVIVEYENDGRPPAPGAKPGGGLTSLGQAAERAGGSMEIRWEPEFRLRLRIPEMKGARA